MSRIDGKSVVSITLVLWALVLISCSKHHDPVAYQNPIDTGEVSKPPVPYNLIAQVGDQSITLSWQMSDTSDVRWYRIARKDSLASEFAVIDSVARRNYQDRRLKNHHVYRYRVCVINQTGYVGSYSHEVAATPSGFGISINGGDEYTRTKLTNLTISAPGGASYIMLANDSFFQNAFWEPYVSQKSWYLSDDDGRKVVFMKARDLDDNETTEIYQDDIILDTWASISSITFSPQDSVLSAGDQIHFSMETGEQKGQARVDIAMAVLNKKLYDDATHGDGIADDGLYELDFVIPSGLEIIEAVIRGRFSDQAGNEAEEIASVKTLTIQNSPQAVQLYTPHPLEDQETTLHLSWSQNQDTDFVSYRLYRSEIPGVDADPTRKLVADINNQFTTWYDDTGLEESTSYYYLLYVYDDYGLVSHSNEVSATTGENQAPDSVTLLITSVDHMPDDPTAALIELKWTRSQEPDFDHYLVYRDIQSPVTTTSTPINLVNEMETTTVTDSGLQLATQYFYRVYVYDNGGLNTGSNEVYATTPSGP